MYPTPSCRLAYTSSEEEAAWFASSHADRICAKGSSPLEVQLAQAWVNYTSGATCMMWSDGVNTSTPGRTKEDGCAGVAF